VTELPRCTSLDGVAMRLAARVRERRIDAGLTQAELALRAGVTVETVSRLERLLHGRPSPGSNPTLETLARLSEALGVEITELLANRSGPDSYLDKLSASLRQATPAARRRVLRVAEALLHEDLPLSLRDSDSDEFEHDSEDSAEQDILDGERPGPTDLPQSGARFMAEEAAMPKAQN
jgi:transcriptional regulator with XRE-family HTH domain